MMSMKFNAKLRKSSESWMKIVNWLKRTNGHQKILRLRAKPFSLEWFVRYCSFTVVLRRWLHTRPPFSKRPDRIYRRICQQLWWARSNSLALVSLFWFLTGLDGKYVSVGHFYKLFLQWKNVIHFFHSDFVGGVVRWNRFESNRYGCLYDVEDMGNSCSNAELDTPCIILHSYIHFSHWHSSAIVGPHLRNCTREDQRNAYVILHEFFMAIKFYKHKISTNASCSLGIPR